MNAATARAKAVAISQKEAAKKAALARKQKASRVKNAPILEAKRLAEIEKEFRDSIGYAVEEGWKSTQITLSSDYRDTLRGQYKYLPEDENKRNECWGVGYLKYAAWGSLVKRVMTKLRRDGYKCVVEAESVEHDESAAYMNSGGECGSETPYYTNDTILTIKW
jgi:hypothetical protein